jgi:hypothetical protein
MVQSLFLNLVASCVFYASFSGDCNEKLPLNEKVLEFVKSKIGMKTGRGECWDLAAEALDFAGADWDHAFKFGRKLNPEKDCIYPGDIIQFEGVKAECKQGNTISTQEMKQHTAVIFEVKQKGSFVLAEQNTSYGGRKVTLSPFELQFVKKGRYYIYRPAK